jgi:transcriptional repressor NrdR
MVARQGRGYRGAVRCPYCQGLDDKVVDSRLADDGAAIRRRRECLACGRRFTTYERLEEVPVVVVKRSGAREPFDRQKLAAGIGRAVTNRPIEDGAVDVIAAEIEEQAREEGPEVASERLGVAVLERLRLLDDVAYLRFASVYKEFENLDDFEREVGELQKTTAPKRR